MVSLAIQLAAQDATFQFDASGNLQSQANASPAPARILGQPQDQIVVPGHPTSFSVVLQDARNMSFQWLFNGSPIPNATDDSFRIPTVGDADQGEYSVLITSALGVVLSDPASLRIDSDADGLPDTWEREHFGGLAQTASGDKDGDGVSNLQEFLDGTDPLDSGSVRYRLRVITEGDGEVEITPVQASYPPGQRVELLARAVGEEPFHGWTGDIISRSHSLSFLVTTNLSLTAHFGPIVMVWTNVLDGNWGEASNWSPNFVPGSNDTAVIQRTVLVTHDAHAELSDFVLGGEFSQPQLVGAGSVTLRGRGRWYAGTIRGAGQLTVLPEGSFDVLNPDLITLLGWHLENRGTLAWLGAGTWSVGAGGVISNAPGAIFQIRGPTTLGVGGGILGQFQNGGRLSVAGTMLFGAELDNYGSVDVQGGVLSLQTGGSNFGDVVVSESSELHLLSGSFSSSPSSTIVGGGALRISAPSANLAGRVQLAGANVFAGGGVINLTGNYVCDHGLMVIAGGNVNFSGTGLITPDTLLLSSGTLGGAQTVTVKQAIDWTGGGMSGPGLTRVPPGALMTISNADSIDLVGRTLESAGVIRWEGSGFLRMRDGVITNRAGALFELSGAGSFLSEGSVNRVDNTGTLRKTKGGQTRLGADVALNNSGLVEIKAGSLIAGGGGRNGGSIHVAEGVDFQVALETFTSDPGSDISGAGGLVVSGGTASFGGEVNLSGSNVFSGGSATFTGHYVCVGNTLTISGGTVRLNASGSVMPRILNLSSGVLGGTQPVTVLETMNWTGGVMDGSTAVALSGIGSDSRGRTLVAPGAILSLSNVDSVGLVRRVLENAGQTLWNGTGPVLLTDSLITNRAGATFVWQGGGSINSGGGASRIDNAGTFRRTSAQAVGGINSVDFANYGTLDVAAGSIGFGGSYVMGPDSVLRPVISPDGGPSVTTRGPVALDGTIDVSLAPGFVPQSGASFVVLKANSISGGFEHFVYPSGLLTLQLTNTPDSVVVRVAEGIPVPQPVFLLPMLAGTNIVLTWSSVSNAVYQVEFSGEPDFRGPLQVLGPVTSSGPTASRVEALTSSNRFYRVRVSQ